LSRIKKIRTDGFLTEEYSYDGQSRVSEYKQTVDYRTSYPMTVNYLYDSLDRVTEVHYPAEYGLTGSPRKVVENSYDSTSRLSEMKYDGAKQASDIVYNASDSSPIPLDGIPNLTYDNATNRITTTGYEYDAAGNQTRSLAADGS